MTASLKTALFFILAAVVVSNPAQKLAALAQHRHSLLAPLSDMTLNAQEGRQKVDRQISQLLSVQNDQGASVSGLDMLIGLAAYPFQGEEESLSEAVVESLLTEQVDHFVEEVSKLDNSSSETNFDELFGKFKGELLANAERLIKLELVIQLLSLYPKKEKEEIVFRGDILSHLQSHLNDKEQILAQKTAFNAEAKVAELNNELQALKDSLQNGHFPQIVILLDLFKNRVFYLEKEINAMVLLAQIDSTYNSGDNASERFAQKLEKLLSVYTETIKSSGQEATITHLANYLREELSLSVKTGSKVGIVPFKRIVPTMVGSFIKSIGLTYSYEAAYGYTKEYLKAITTFNNEKDNVIGFLKSYIEDKSRFFTIHDIVEKVETVDALKAVDIIKRLPYDNDKMGEWWVAILANLPKVLEAISAELIDGVENTKQVVNTRVSAFADYPEYYTGLYNLFMEAVADLGDQMADQSIWMSAFLDYVNDRFDEKETPTAKFLHKWYPMVIFHTLLFRTETEGFVFFKDFNSGEFAALHQEFISKIQDKTKTLMFNFFPINLEKHPVEGMPKKYKPSESKKMAYMVDMIGKRIPYINFKQEKNNLAVKESELQMFAGEGASHHSTGYRMQDSMVRKVVPTTKVTSPVNNQITQVKEEIIPVINQPIVHEPIINQPIINDPIINDPIINQPIVNEPIINQPTINEPIINDPVIDIKATTDLKEREEEDHSKITPLRIPLNDIDEEDQSPTNNLSGSIKTPVVHSDTGLDSPAFNKINGSPVHDEDHNGVQLTGDAIPVNPISLVSIDSTHPEWDNLVEVVKGQLSPEMVAKLQKAPELFEIINDKQIEIHENGDETWYYYVQVVEKESACYDSIVE